MQTNRQMALLGLGASEAGTPTTTGGSTGGGGFWGGDGFTFDDVKSIFNTAAPIVQDQLNKNKVTTTTNMPPPPASTGMSTMAKVGIAAAVLGLGAAVVYGVRKAKKKASK
jgi:hypothetical protein